MVGEREINKWKISRIYIFFLTHIIDCYFFSRYFKTYLGIKMGNEREYQRVENCRQTTEKIKQHPVLVRLRFPQHVRVQFSVYRNYRKSSRFKYGIVVYTAAEAEPSSASFASFVFSSFASVFPLHYCSSLQLPLLCFSLLSVFFSSLLFCSVLFSLVQFTRRL